jgi:hypothetical protein
MATFTHDAAPTQYVEADPSALPTDGASAIPSAAR